MKVHEIEEGMRFTRLVTIARMRMPDKRQLVWGWLCRCDCGVHICVFSKNLITGNSKSCGCLPFWRKYIAGVHPGDRWGKLVAIRLAGTNRRGEVLWEYQCDCGEKVVMAHKAVLNRPVASCGCIASECSSKKLHDYRRSLLDK
jgi:hypothetical protein